MHKPPDAHAAFRELALELERQGVSPETIIDAAFVLWGNAASRMAGPEAVAATLKDMAALIAGEVRETRTTTH